MNKKYRAPELRINVYKIDSDIANIIIGETSSIPFDPNPDEELD